MRRWVSEGQFDLPDPDARGETDSWILGFVISATSLREAEADNRHPRRGSGVLPRMWLTTYGKRSLPTD